VTESYPENPLLTTPLIDFTAWLENLRTDVSETVGGVVLRGSRAVQVGGDSGTHRPTSAAGALVGFALRNTTAAPVTAYLRDGRDANAPIVMPLRFEAEGIDRDNFGPAGINLTEGLYVDAPAGALEGAVYLRGVD
jgi:hypothetical protein